MEIFIVSTFYVQIFDEARKFSFGSPLRAAIAYGGECRLIKTPEKRIIQKTILWISHFKYLF